MLYLKNQNSKDGLLEDALNSVLNGGIGSPTLDNIKDTITDDDIDVIQQWAIWYFTNYGEETLQHVKFTKEDKTLPIIDTKTVSTTANNMDDTKYDYCKYLYK